MQFPPRNPLRLEALLGGVLALLLGSAVLAAWYAIATALGFHAR